MIVQAEIDFGFGQMNSSNDKVEVDIWYASTYELEESQIDFASLARMQDIFKDHVVF